MMPPLMNNHHCYIGSLGDVCRWLGPKAEALGVEIYPGFAAAEVLYDDSGAVRGIATGDMGVGRDGKPKDSFTRGMELLGKYTLFAEGARGSLSKQLIAKYLARRQERTVEIRHRVEGSLGDRSRQAPEGPDPAFVRLAAEQFDRRRLVPLPLRRQQGGGRLRRASQLRRSVSVAVRRIPALQDASLDSHRVRRRQADFLWRARDHRGRLSIGAASELPGRRADRLRGGLCQRAAHQGRAQRDGQRHARRRTCRDRARRRPRQ